MAQPGDTTIVQTFSPDIQNNPNAAYDSPGRSWFQFPPSDNGLEYQKILMYYNLRCFSDGTAGGLGFPCGEWDYLTYTYLFQHTGVMDSTQTNHPHYKVNNLDFDEANLTSQPVFIFHQQLLDTTITDEVNNASTAQIGLENVLIAQPLGTQFGQRVQYIYPPEDLTAAGLSVGSQIGRMAFHFPNGDIMFDRLKVEIAFGDSALTNANDPTLLFQEIFDYPVYSNTTGWFEIGINGDVLWDGASSIVLRLSYRNELGQSGTTWSMQETADLNGSDFSATDRYISFDWQDEVKIPAEAFNDITEQISISFWQYGDPDAQPQDGTIFEGVNAQNQRVLNAHLPWSNSRVYWDAGYDDGYDRIDKLAQTQNFEGKWNHWCFTKNTSTGSMKIYLNGVLWHSGTGKDNPMNDITRFSIGGATSWSNFYNGNMDEFAVFNVELDAATISQWMNRDLNTDHTAWNNLMVYYQFNEVNGEMVLDGSGNNHHGWVHGNASRVLYEPEELWRNESLVAQRPVIQFITGEFSSHTESMILTVSEEIPPVSVVEYDIQNYTPVVSAVEYAFEEQNSFTIDINGDTVNVNLIAAEYTLNNDDLTYWQTPFEVVNRYELNRFITPYGIQLTLGPDGWTWITDVTDWAPLLRDSVELESGNWQELLDLKFVFIEGTPARDVLRVEKVWDQNVGIADFDNQITAKTITKQPEEAMWKLVTTNTGHGFGFDNNNCGEFCNNIQSVEVNGEPEWSWDIMQECATNPLYPQGGTWIYDRAGWCPGMNSATKEFELSSFTGNENSFTVDYDVQYDPYGNYVFFGTLFGYGAANHQHDAEVEMITAPSNWKIHSRWNPICDQPSFILRNKGSQPLTDLNIYYGVNGGAMESLHWTGNLQFMESEEVLLNYSDPVLWQGDDEQELTFYVNLGLSMDGADENTSNNNATSTFHRPVTYQYANLDDNRVIIELKTNAAFTETSYTLYDINDNIVFSRSDFGAANTTYKDTIALNSGCYKFHLKDTDDDGLSFFNNDDGNGHCKLDKVAGFDFINFETDFGKEIIHYFNWNTNLVKVDEVEEIRAQLQLFPNPTNGMSTLRAEGFDRNVQVEIFNAMGMHVGDETYQRRSSSDGIELSVSNFSAGIYHIHVSDGKHHSTIKMIRE